MNSQTHRFFGLMLIAAIALPTTGCAYSGGPIEGRVLEEGTDKPIPGAIVVARWQGTAFSFVESPTVCIHAETATTNKDGRYRIPFWRANVEPSGVHGIEPIVTPYKPGYQWPSRTPQDLGGGTQYLRTFTGTREEGLRKTAGATVDCGSAGESKKNLLPLYRKLYADALPLAVTKEDKYILSNLLFKIEELELPYEEAEKRHIERHNAIYHEK